MIVLVLLSSLVLSTVNGLQNGLHLGLTVFIRKSALHAGFGPPKIDSAAKSLSEAKEKPCPCQSGKLYVQCCHKFHAGSASSTPSATELVRSRFSALCLKIEPKYLIDTTHPRHKEYIGPEQESKTKTWMKALREFANEYNFLQLEFDDESRDGSVDVSTVPVGTQTTVSFKAKMSKAGVGVEDRTHEYLTEVSTFECVEGEDGNKKWLYRDAKVNNPFKNIKQEIVPQKQKFITTAKRGVPKGN